MRYLPLLFALAVMSSPVFGQTSTAKDVADIKAVMIAMWDAVEKGEIDRYATEGDIDLWRSQSQH